MKNLTGITLNGEWLGNNVLINGMFRNICTISPVVMQEFIHLINGIDELDEAVSIQNYICKDKNTIDIEFANKELKGLASLYFDMNNDSTEVINSFLKLDRNEGLLLEMDSDMKEVENAGKVSKGRKRKPRRKQDNAMPNENFQEDYSVDGNYAEEDYYNDDNYSNDENYCNDEDFAQYYDVQNDSYDNGFVQQTEYQPGSYDGYACDEEYPQMQAQEVRLNVAAEGRNFAQSYDDNGASYQPEEARNNYEEPAQLNNSQLESGSRTEEAALGEATQRVEDNGKNSEDENFRTEQNETGSEMSARQNGRPRQRGGQVAPQRPMRGQNPSAQAAPQGRGRGQVTASSDLQQIVITANSINITPSDFDQENKRGSRSRRGGEDVEATEGRTRRNPECEENENKEAVVAEEVVQEKAEENKVENHIIIPEIINENYNPEDISEFLADFYTSDKIEAELTREQKLLEEIANLKEEINELHGQKRGSAEEEEETPMTLEEFYARQLKKHESKANTYGYTFRIVGTNKRIRANVLDQELFIAGDKLYKWGEMLYLEH